MNLEWRVARRYLASRRGTRFLSLITLIAIGGVAVGVTALIVVTAVMNGLQTELRKGILGVNPHVFVLTYGEGMRMDGWQAPLLKVRTVDGVVAAAPFVHTEVGLQNRGKYAEAAVLRGIDVSAAGSAVTDIPAILRKARIDLERTRSGLPGLAAGSDAGRAAGADPRRHGNAHLLHQRAHGAHGHRAQDGDVRVRGRLPHRDVGVRQQVRVHHTGRRAGPCRAGHRRQRAGGARGGPVPGARAVGGASSRRWASRTARTTG